MTEPSTPRKAEGDAASVPVRMIFEAIESAQDGASREVLIALSAVREMFEAYLAELSATSEDDDGTETEGDSDGEPRA